MDIHKLIFYMHILGICLPVTLTYIFLVNVLTGQEIRPVSEEINKVQSVDF